LAGLLEIHGLQAPADAPPRHIQLTTGDVDKFTVIADRLFDSYFRNVERVAVAGAV
jgi:hypothetical protein